MISTVKSQTQGMIGVLAETSSIDVESFILFSYQIMLIIF